jgi:hypothetical protein
MDILIVVGALIVGFSIGWNLHERVVAVKASRMLAELEKQIKEDTVSADVIKITIEKDNGILFAYHKETSQFITQAKDRKELEKKLAELYPGKTFGVTPQNLSEIGFTS